MSSLSLSRIPRPYQFALLAVLLVAALWFLVVQKMVSSSSSESTTPATHAPTIVHHGVTGLIHHGPTGAVAITHRHTTVVKTAAPSVHHGVSGAAGSQGALAAHPAASTHAATAAGTAAKPASSGPAKSSVVKEIESESAENKIALVLFWNPAASVDRFVHGELKFAGQISSGTVAVHYAPASQVAEYGKYTQKVLINETPTILMVTPGGQATTLAGFNDFRSIEQAISEAANPFAGVSEAALFAYRQKVATACAPVTNRLRNFLPTAFNPSSSEKYVQSSLHAILGQNAALLTTLRTMPTPAGADVALFQKDVKASEHLFAQESVILTQMLTAARHRNKAAFLAAIHQVEHVSGGGYQIIADVCPAE